MPELPEVETIKRGLKGLVGQLISDVKIAWAKSFQVSESQISDIRGKKITKVERKGKVLIVSLSNGHSLLIHLKMTGQLVWDRARKQETGNSSQVPNSRLPISHRLVGGHPTPSMVHDLPDKSTRVIFEFKSGDKLFLNDQRKFGWIKLVPSEQVPSSELIASLGPEPLSRGFSLSSFTFQLKRRAKSPIKAVILDQTVVAGVGNIYADESLHLAKIHPLTPAGKLSPAKTKTLHAAIRDIIKLGIKHGGTSLRDYVNVMGGKGDYLNYARVFRRQGQPCPVCGTTIEKIRVAGRGTHLCPICQKAPRNK